MRFNRSWKDCSMTIMGYASIIVFVVSVFIMFVKFEGIFEKLALFGIMFSMSTWLLLLPYGED